MDKKIIKIASKTENHSFLNNHTHFKKLKNSTCGDEIKIYLIVKKGKIIKLKYEGECCIYTQASASLLSRNIKNKSSSNIEFLLKTSIELFQNKKVHLDKEWKSFLHIMIKSNILRKECLLLPLKATLKALRN
tara:strand:- start:94 stop:492 length:399 start_codon:yes stop_codon:yes gene_type:complete